MFGSTINNFNFITAKNDFKIGENQMAFIMIRVEVPGATASQLNAKIPGDADSEADTKAREGVVELRNLMDSILAGTTPAQVNVAVRQDTQAVTAQGDGISASYNLK